MRRFHPYPVNPHQDGLTVAAFYGGMAGCSLLIIAVFAVMLWLIWPGAARAHEAASGMRYDGACCNGDALGLSGDCQQIPETSVREIPGGFEITLRPGDHRLVTKLHVFTIQQSKTRKSTDGRFHACLWPTEDKLQCFYAPPPGV